MVENDNSSAWIAAGTQMATTAMNAADSRAGRKWQEEQMAVDRAWQEQMYQRQLDDSIAWREHQEAYNSPIAQMQRYRDAGINPMYAVTGSGANTLTQPFSASSGGFKTSSPMPYGNKNYSFDYAQIAAIGNQTKVANAQAADYQASARLKNAEARAKEFDNVSLDILDKMFADHETFGFMSYHELRSYVKMEALSYEEKYQGLSFNDAKDKFLHSQELRDFERELRPQERDKFISELNLCKSNEEIMRVAAKWAKANQFIDAGAKVLGSAAGLVSSVKGSSVLPSASSTPNVRRTEHHHYGDTYNNINN